MNVARAAGRLAALFGIVVLALALATVTLRRFVERALLYRPDRKHDATPADLHMPRVQEVWLDAADGVKLHAFHLPHLGARAIVVYLHGNAGNNADRLPIAQEMAAFFYEVLLLDYRGYGKSDGTPSEAGLYADAGAALAFARRRGMPVILYGESLGGAVAIDLAARERIDGLVVQSSFTSLPDLAAAIWAPLGRLVSPSYVSIDKIGRVRAPILFVHGERDELVPLSHGRRLYEAAHPPKRFVSVPAAGHDDVFDLATDQILRHMSELPGKR